MQYPHLPVTYFTFPGGRFKAVTTSFDDGREEDRRLVAMFNRYGIRGTFNLNSGLNSPDRIDRSEYTKLYEGHEIACHTWTHPTIARCPGEQVAQQVLQDRRALEALTDAPVRGLAYPNGSYDNGIMQLLPCLGIRYARTVRSTRTFDIPENWYAWHPTCHFSENLAELSEQFVTNKKRQYLKLFYVWGHSFELPENNGWGVMENFCRTVGGREDVWYATNIEIVNYLEDAKRLQYTAAGDQVYNPNARSVWIEVDGTVRKIPGGQTVRLIEGELPYETV